MLVRPHMTVNCLGAAHSVLVLLQEGHFVLRLPDRIQEMPLVVVPHCCCCLHTCTPCLSSLKSAHRFHSRLMLLLLQQALIVWLLKKNTAVPFELAMRP